jgi:ribosome-associated translation inhibitor RaiA
VKTRIDDSSAVVDDRLRAHLTRRLAFALGGVGERVEAVRVRLSAESTRGSPLDRCEIEVTLRPRHLLVADTGGDLFAAVASATSRLKRSLGRALEREHTWENGQPPSVTVRRPRGRASAAGR